ncbi:MAG: Gfo/Idh/MocA family oxidoreductase [Acutalibacteraceae bacterium]|nr:Gfo/Idh/MocA family oxidoreductase [Acutalibacteraceae bacterium]
MLRIATIGTSWITSSFIGGLDLIDDCFTLEAVYSRTAERGEEFLKEIGKTARVFDDLDKLALDENIDAVYIASPNSCHFEQSMKMVRAGKHIIVEKPIVTTEEEFLILANEAKKNNVVFMEAIIGMHLPARRILKNAVDRIGKISNCRFEFCQLSSKYKDYLLGNNPNIFNPAFATGTLMDLGIYCVYPAIDLFGVPDTIYTQASFLDNGSDGTVSAIFTYSDKIVNIISSKTCQSDYPSEILGDNGKISVGHISKYDDIYITLDSKEEQLVGEMTKEELMSYEAKDFYRYITEPQETKYEYKEMQELAHTVCAVMEAMRMQSNIIFTNK